MQESVIYRSLQEEAEVRKQREIAINLLQAGVAVNVIASATGLPIEEVQRLQRSDVPCVSPE